MFTGIIEEQGSILKVLHAGQSSRIQIQCSTVLDGLHTGDSVAVNGICLTAAAVQQKTLNGNGSFTADVMPETFRRTSFRLLHTGSTVNLERAMKADGRFGGHIVSGHIDGTGVIQSVTAEGNAVLFTVRAESAVIGGIVEKGSVAVDGISLTVVSVHVGNPGTFMVSVIPHTREHTSLAQKKNGSLVNIECDMLGKYVMRYAALQAAGPERRANYIEADIWKRMKAEQDLLQ